MNDGAIKDQYIKIAAVKCALPFWQAFCRAVLCNLLVCLAIWMAIAGRSVFDKAVAIVFPISAFVAAGFEHCVANMYFIPMAMFLLSADPSATALHTEISGAGLMRNMIPVILGNLTGGSVLVGLVYYLIYLRKKPEV
jgi:formate/nitrite transporter